ncbi:hypothetical protein [Fulvimarina manganoxydans]|uniref:hypothetical protein n=1 Tax=Fulvimarina manganoxydans TaxID=937218 RepID=UPI002356886A|nr:hypothetical protein [Fulvimarina manganoxydans]
MTAASGVIMARAPDDRAGMAASIEEVSFELGGAIGIAVLGSVLTAVYGASLKGSDGAGVSPMVLDSLDEALVAAARLSEAAGETLRAAAFDQAFVAIIAIAAALTFLTACAIGIMKAKGGIRTRPSQGPCVG